MSHPAKTGAGQPEARATFAAAERADGSEPAHAGLHATPDTAPLAGSLEHGQREAAHVLEEGATGESRGAVDAAKGSPDRIAVHPDKDPQGKLDQEIDPSVLI